MSDFFPQLPSVLVQQRLCSAAFPSLWRLARLARPGQGLEYRYIIPSLLPLKAAVDRAFEIQMPERSP